jgi:hypothetical protein
VTAFYQALKALGEFVVYLMTKFFGFGFFGDGSDGAAVVDGTNTFSWASKAGPVYTLLRDVYLSSFTIPTAAVAQLNAHGYRIYVNGKFEIVPTVGAYVGVNAADANVTAGTIAGTGASGGAGVGAGSPGGNNIGVGYSGNGGAGGAGSGGAGGAGGTVPASGVNYGGHGVYAAPLLGYQVGGGATPSNGLGVATMLSGGAGGGGGGGDGGSGGGVGGRGGGVLAIAAREIVLSNADRLQAKGQSGGNGGGANRGGGGGGGGGTLLLVYGKITVSAGSLDAATCCPGGAAGTGGGGAGVAGSVGSNGAVIQKQVG